MANEKILVIDDDKIILKFVEKILVDAGYTVITAGNGQEGIDKLSLAEGKEVKVIITDLNMPVKDGFQVLKEVQMISDRSIPVAIFTTENLVDTSIKALRDGAFDFLVKPIKSDALLKVINRGVDYYSRINKVIQSQIKSNKHANLSYNVIIPNDLSYTDGVFHTLIQDMIAFGFNPDIKNNMRLAMDEMISNAIYHGNLDVHGEKFDPGKSASESRFFIEVKEKLSKAEYASKVVKIGYTIDAEKAVVIIEDEGKGFTPTEYIITPENLLKVSGRGIFLTKLYVDEVEYKGRGNIVVLTKYNK